LTVTGWSSFGDPSFLAVPYDNQEHGLMFVIRPSQSDVVYMNRSWEVVGKKLNKLRREILVKEELQDPTMSRRSELAA
jgi:hypothetical protein